jgi:hypothetical protein
VSLVPPQIPHGLTRARTRDFASERPATNRLSHGTALHTFTLVLGNVRTSAQRLHISLKADIGPERARTLTDTSIFFHWPKYSAAETSSSNFASLSCVYAFPSFHHQRSISANGTNVELASRRTPEAQRCVNNAGGDRGCQNILI